MYVRKKSLSARKIQTNLKHFHLLNKHTHDSLWLGLLRRVNSDLGISGSKTFTFNCENILFAAHYFVCVLSFLELSNLCYAFSTCLPWLMSFSRYHTSIWYFSRPKPFLLGGNWIGRKFLFKKNATRFSSLLYKFHACVNFGVSSFNADSNGFPKYRNILL